MPFAPKPHNQQDLEARAAERERQRGTARARGYDSAWEKYSAQRLREHPTCVMCKQEGLIVRARVTDHIKPARYFPELFMDPNNHQSLCFTHNQIKTIADERLYARRTP